MNHRVNVHSKWKGVRKGKGNGDARGKKKERNRKEVLKLPKDCRVWMAARVPT